MVLEGILGDQSKKALKGQTMARRDGKEVEDIEEPFFKEASSTHRPQVHH
jgi:hypothetical protein